jgi:hypothetical protein
MYITLFRKDNRPCILVRKVGTHNSLEFVGLNTLHTLDVHFKVRTSYEHDLYYHSHIHTFTISKPLMYYDTLVLQSLSTLKLVNFI